MLQEFLITAVLALRLISSSDSDSDSEGDASTVASASGISQYTRMQTLFRFSLGLSTFYDVRGIPYQYYVPRDGLIPMDLNNGHIKIPCKRPASSKKTQKSALNGNERVRSSGPVNNETVYFCGKYSWRLAATTRQLTGPESTRANLWRRDLVPLNRLMLALGSPIFLGNFFYALTSLTEINGTTILSRFYYAPVFTAVYGCEWNNVSTDLSVTEMKLNVFSICIEPSDAPEDASIPPMRRPQRIIDAGLRKDSQNEIYDVSAVLKANATDKLSMAEKRFVSEEWSALFADSSKMAPKRLPKNASPYKNIKTPFGNYFEDYLVAGGPKQIAFHRYDYLNGAYIFIYGPGDRKHFNYGVDNSKMMIFLNPRTHFKDERKMWGMCVDLWRQEMRDRYGTDANSRLVHPHAYLDETVSTVPYYGMVHRHEALCSLLDMEPPASAKRRRMPAKQRKPRKQQRGSSSNSKKRAVTGPAESGALILPPMSYLPVCSVPPPDGLVNPWTSNTENGAYEAPYLNPEPGSSSLYSESSICCINDPSMPRTSGYSSNGSIGWQQDGLFPESADTVWSSGWLPDAEPYTAAAGQNVLFYKTADTASGTYDGAPPTWLEYAVPFTEQAYPYSSTDYLPPRPEYGGMESGFLTAMQHVDNEPFARMAHGM